MRVSRRFSFSPASHQPTYFGAPRADSRAHHRVLIVSSS